MGSLFGSNIKKPPPPPVVKSPDQLREEASAAAVDELRRRKRSGRGSTILTSGLDQSPVSRKTLLGQ